MWKRRDADLDHVKTKHRLAGVEIHTAWMMRNYPEQSRIAGFESLSDLDRRAAVGRERRIDIAKAALRGPKAAKTLRKNYQQTDAYLHLTHAERVTAIRDIADAVGSWDEAWLFGDAELKAVHTGTPERLFAYAFEQVVSRFHHYLEYYSQEAVGLIVQDNNETAARHLTNLMRRFHDRGTTWVQIPRIIETPLFVDSRLTGMVQLADLCAYATRRFFENGETDLFDRIYPRFDRVNGRLVGLRHFTSKTPCSCRVCVDHGRT